MSGRQKSTNSTNDATRFRAGAKVGHKLARDYSNKHARGLGDSADKFIYKEIFVGVFREISDKNPALVF